MESLKTKNQVLKTEKEKEIAKHEDELAEVVDKHSKDMQDLGEGLSFYLISALIIRKLKFKKFLRHAML